ncbi:histidinol-phosphate transaminase [Tsukamurella serpentis]
MATPSQNRSTQLSIRSDLDALPAYVPGRTVPGAIKLASNEVVEGPLPAVASALTELLRHANRYPDNGASALRVELAKLTGTTEEQVHVGCGSVALCQDLVQISCRPGDEVVFAWRSFEAYPIITRVVGAVPVQVPLTDDFTHDLDAMAAAITDRTRLVFVCNPNNPTGTTVSQQQLEDFLAAVPPHVIVALDEAYYEYHRPNDLTGERIDGAALISRYRNVIALRTFSKAYGLAGMRVGYAIADPELITALTRVHLPFSVSAPAQAAAIASLRVGEELLARTESVVAERVRVRDALRAAGFDVPPSQANFLWLPLGDESMRFTADAADAGLLLRGFDGAGVRVTITVAEENDAFLAFATRWGEDGDR